MNDEHLKLHPKAAANLDEKAAEISDVMKIDVRPPAHGVPIGFSIEGTISTNDIIGRATVSMLDQLTGDVVARGHYTPEGVVGLQGDDYKSVRELAGRVLKGREFRSAVSRESVEEVIVDWLVAEPDTRASFSNHLLDNLRPKVCLREVWIPISNLLLDGRFELGRVKLMPLTSAHFDRWEAESEADLSASRSQYQGYAVAFAEVVADERLAVAKVRGWAKDALGVLRLMHPASFMPNTTCYVSLMGESPLPMEHSLMFTSGATLPQIHSAQGGPPGFLWPLPLSDVQNSAELLQPLHTALGRDDRSEMEQALLSAVLLYSQAATRDELGEKVVHIFAALESLFLRNASEPIQQNLSERLAFLVRDTAEERRELSKTVRRVYADRSSFVHHGQQPHESTDLSTVMLAGWTALVVLAQRLDVYKSKADFHEHLDTMKFS